MGIIRDHLPQVSPICTTKHEAYDLTFLPVGLGGGVGWASSHNQKFREVGYDHHPYRPEFAEINAPRVFSCHIIPQLHSGIIWQLNINPRSLQIVVIGSFYSN